VSDAVTRLIGILATKGVQLFAVVKQSEEACKVGLERHETTLVVFGNPSAGTPVMIAAPLAALDLPLKPLNWAVGQQTNLRYYSPSELSSRHHLSGELAHCFTVIDALSDALVAP
jgi:uncharacterized protein (DUF302 family)